MQASDRRAPLPVSPRIAPLLVALARDWIPTPLVLGRVQTLQRSNQDLSALGPVAELRGDMLIVTLCGEAFLAAFHTLLPINRVGDLHGSCAGDQKFTTDSLSRLTASDESLVMEAARWQIVNGTPPPIWIGRIDGTLGVDGGGNLSVERRASGDLKFGSAGHFRFSGSYTYYLIRSGSRGDGSWNLVVDTGAGAPDSELLGADFLLLQFVFGRQFRIATFHGVDEQRHTVAAISGVGSRKTPHSHSFPPVPLERNNTQWIDACWSALLFNRVAAAWSTKSDWRPPFYMALTSCLDATTFHVDSDYLRLHVGLEAFAYWVLRAVGQGERTVVRNKPEWKKWVKQNEAAIRDLANPGFEDMLYNGVIGAYRHPSGRVVMSAFLTYGVTLLPEMTAELGERGTIVHQGFMSPDGYDAPRELRRIALVRSMLVALLSKAADYGGPINGWEIGGMGRPLEPTDWWTVRAADRDFAQEAFIATEHA